MTDNEREQVALFRYGLIAPLLNGQCSSSEYLSKICSQTYNVPYYGTKEFAPKTVMCWLRDYKRSGFNALLPKSRSDKGKSRVIDIDIKDRVLEFRTVNRECSVVLFYERLISKGIISPDTASYHTVYRILRLNNLVSPDDKKSTERKRFSYDQVNILWQGDMSVGPYLNIGGRKLKTHLFAFIDDCSRLVPYASFSFSEKFESMKSVLKEALIRRGIPKIIYVDNGKVYHSSTLHLACAHLGITLSHTRPYDPESKGKIERFFGTVRRRFYPSLNDNTPKSIDELNQRFLLWLEEDYHRKLHSSIDMTPLDKFMSQAALVKMVDDPKSLDNIFLKRDYRKVHHDGTISVNNKLYEVPLRLVGQRVEVRFDSQMIDDVYVFEDSKLIFTAKPISFTDNALIKRSRNIDKKGISFEELFSNTKEGEA